MFSFHTRVVAPVPQVCLFTGAPPLLDRVWGPHSTMQIGRQSLSACGCPPERPLGKTGVGDGPAQVAVGRAQVSRPGLRILSLRSHLLPLEPHVDGDVGVGLRPQKSQQVSREGNLGFFSTCWQPLGRSAMAQW